MHSCSRIYLKNPYSYLRTSHDVPKPDIRRAQTNNVVRFSVANMLKMIYFTFWHCNWICLRSKQKIMVNRNTHSIGNNVRFGGLVGLLFVIVVCTYGMRTQLTEKLPQSVEKKARTFGHISQILLSLKTVIFLDSEDINKK